MKAKIVKAVASFGCLQFFPSDAAAREEIMRLLERMVWDPQQLDWLVRVMIDRVGKWHGTVELRGVFCSRFAPKDGIEANCAETPYFCPAEMEMRAICEHNEAKLPELSAGARELRMIAAPEESTLHPLAQAIIAPLMESTKFPTKPLSLAEQKRAQEVDKMLMRIMGEA